jgi:uncharacterized protein YbaR (Trm112 family)/SAM-dependent methyltransferase
MKPWLYSFLSCQECSGELALAESLETQEQELVTGTLECAECELTWPVLGGVPLMLTDPGRYLASYRESVLASLVEHERASSAALKLVDDFSAGYSVEPMRYADDWTAHESGGPEPMIAAGTSALSTFQKLVDENRGNGLRSSVLKLLDSQRYDAIIEVGPGAGGLSRLLAERCDNLVLVDLSLRSLLCSQRIAAPGGAEVAAVLGDVAVLEMAADWASAVVAANVVDLLEEPERFLVAVSRWLVRRGELILTTPDPSLGGDNDDALRDMMEPLEYKIDELKDGIPWLRVHSARYSQLYWLQALRASILS